MTPPFDSVALTTAHELAGFDSGVAALDDWLIGHALRAQRAATARAYVWVKPEESERVWAYSSLAPTEVERAALSRGPSSGFSIVTVEAMLD